jgi:hypothetical protein
MFAVALKSMHILRLPNGPMHSGIYEDRGGAVKVAGTDFIRFLEVLLADLTAFVHGTPGHAFLI